MAEMKETIKGIKIKNLFAGNLKRLRVIAHKSQLDLAADAGLATNFINDIEKGKKWVSARTIEKLATALKVEPYQFFISSPKWNSQEAEVFSHYFDDLSDSVTKMLKEYRSHYLGETINDAERGKNKDS